MADETKLGPACLAPPLTDKALASYGSLVGGVPAGQLRDALDELLALVRKWWGLPDSTHTDGESLRVIHKGGVVDVRMQPLDAAHAASLDEHLPYGSELDLYAKMLDGISPTEQKPLRDAAHHLLWHAKELARGREPMTADVLK